MSKLILPPGTVEKPSDEKYSALVAELQQAKSQLASLEILDALEQVEPEGLGQDLLRFRFPRAKHRDIPFGFKLQRRLQGQRAVVAVLEQQLEEWNAQETAYHEAEEAK